MAMPLKNPAVPPRAISPPVQSSAEEPSPSNCSTKRGKNGTSICRQNAIPAVNASTGNINRISPTGAGMPSTLGAATSRGGSGTNRMISSAEMVNSTPAAKNGTR